MWIEIENELNEWLIGSLPDCLGWLVLGQLLPLLFLVFALFIVSISFPSHNWPHLSCDISDKSLRVQLSDLRDSHSFAFCLFYCNSSSCFWAQRLITINLSDDLHRLLLGQRSLLVLLIPLSMCWWIDDDGMTHGLQAWSILENEKRVRLKLSLLWFFLLNATNGGVNEEHHNLLLWVTLLSPKTQQPKIKRRTRAATTLLARCDELELNYNCKRLHRRLCHCVFFFCWFRYLFDFTIKMEEPFFFYFLLLRGTHSKRNDQNFFQCACASLDSKQKINILSFLRFWPQLGERHCHRVLPREIQVIW